MRSYWENFLQGTELLIFVVDSIDEDRFTVAKEELTKLLADQRLKGVPLVVVANKQVMQSRGIFCPSVCIFVCPFIVGLSVHLSRRRVLDSVEIKYALTILTVPLHT